MFLITFPVFSLWCFAIAASVFTDRSDRPLFPGYIGYVNIWCGLLYFPAAAIIFFKNGPLAFNGILGMYVPLAAFFFWMVCMTLELVKSINRDKDAPAIAVDANATSRAGEMTNVATAGVRS